MRDAVTTADASTTSVVLRRNTLGVFWYLPMRMLAARTWGGSRGHEDSKARMPSSAMLHRSGLCASEPPTHRLEACPCTLAAITDRDQLTQQHTSAAAAKHHAAAKGLLPLLLQYGGHGTLRRHHAHVEFGDIRSYSQRSAKRLDHLHRTGQVAAAAVVLETSCTVVVAPQRRPRSEDCAHSKAAGSDTLRLQ